MFRARTAAGFAAGALFAATASAAAVQPESRPPLVDRRAFLNEVPTSDDPRRVPSAPGDARGPDRATVLLGGFLFDGTGADSRVATVVFERNRIAAVLDPSASGWPEGESGWPADALVLEVAGHTVLPGLVDLHTHLTYTEPGVPQALAIDPVHQTLRALERLEVFIASGITSIRDTGSAGTAPFILKRWVNENRIPGPRVFAAGSLITGTGGHGAEGLSIHHPLHGGIVEASGPDEFRDAVRQQFKMGADLIKIASHYSREEIAAAVDEAHALGLKVTVDSETFYTGWAVEAGADTIEHPLPRTDEVIRMMADFGTASVPTIITYDYIFNERGSYHGSTSRRFELNGETSRAMLRRLKEAGILIGVGTDLILENFRDLPYAYLWELESYLESGFTASEALVAATRDSARILGLEDKIGTVEVGKLADLLIVEGDPLTDLGALANVAEVFRDGYWVVRNGAVAPTPAETRVRPGPGIEERPPS